MLRRDTTARTKGAREASDEACTAVKLAPSCDPIASRMRELSRACPHVQGLASRDTPPPHPRSTCPTLALAGEESCDD
eukprot:COSAG02_NODE_607_length_19608_cov_33.568968_15_plen_78_part_00